MWYCDLYLGKHQGSTLYQMQVVSHLFEVWKDLLVDMAFQNYLSVIMQKTL